MLKNYDLAAELTALRRELHRMPEISGEEEKTAARMAAWAAGAMASVKGKSASSPPPPPPPPVPGPPPLPRSKIEVEGQKILLLFNTTTMIRLDSSGIKLKCGASELVIGPSGITAKPMVTGG